MAEPEPLARTITRLLQQWQAGEVGALESPMPLVYSELQGMLDGALAELEAIDPRRPRDATGRPAGPKRA